MTLLRLLLGAMVLPPHPPVEGAPCMVQACGWAGSNNQRSTRDILVRWYKAAAERGGRPAPSARSANPPFMRQAITVVGLDLAALAYSVADAKQRCAASRPRLLALRMCVDSLCVHERACCRPSAACLVAGR